MSSSQESQQVAVVTGANSGIGRATALHLAQHGYTVFGTVRSLNKADKLLAKASELGVTIELVEMDVADDDSVRTGFADIMRKVSHIDVLVNNAASAETVSPKNAHLRSITNHLMSTLLVQFVARSKCFLACAHEKPEPSSTSHQLLAALLRLLSRHMLRASGLSKA